MSLNYTITESIEQLRQSLQELFSVQQQELDAIVSRQHLDISTYTERKEALLQRITELDGYLAQHPESQQLVENPELAKQVEELQSTLQECQRQNQVNEQVVAVTLNRIQQLRSSLIQSHRKESMTYDGKGRIR